MPAAKAIVKADVTLSKQDGYTRLAFKFEKQIRVSVTELGSILVLKFSESIDVDVRQLVGSPIDLIAAAQRDPDGEAVRIALVRKVKLQTIPTGRSFVLGLLPDN